MENLQVILSMGGTILGLTLTTLTFLLKTVKNAKAKKRIEQAVEIANSILPFIREAEKFTAYSGEEKKAYVMTKANQFALDNKIKFNSTLVGEKIEELVTLTRQVNAKGNPTKAEVGKELKQGSWL